MVEAIVRELRERRSSLDQQSIETLYLGGGTPSLLTLEELKRMLNTVKEQYLLSGDAEITLEANPDDLNPGSLEGWRAAGINRLSIGIQSFRNSDLQWMNRAHTAEESLAGIGLVRAAGFDNFSIDLIYGTPGLTDAAWEENMEIAIKNGVPHISCYALTVEEKTALAHMVKTGKMPDTDPEQQSRQFLMLMDRLRRAGFEHYEISNFALPGYRSRHNSSYWRGDIYLGAGPGAHTYDGYKRRWNISNNALYIKSVEAGLPYSEEEELTVENRRHEYIMTSLRTAEGLSLSYFITHFGQGETESLVEKAERYLQLTAAEGEVRLILTPQELKLTDEGRLFADGIAGFLF